MSIDSNLRLGLQKTSLLDWPPQIAALIFFPGCNLRCPWCHNPELINPGPSANLLPWPAVHHFLAERQSVVQGVVASGGEALHHPALVPVLTAIKALGYKIRLDTNGTLPTALAELPTDLIDAVAMDLKLGADLQALPGQRESLAIVRQRWTEQHQRLVYLPHWSAATLAPILLELLGEGASLRLAAFRPGRCLDPRWNAKAATSPAALAKAAEILRAAGINAIT